MGERREIERILVSLEARWKGFVGHGTARVSNFTTVGCYLETLEEVHNREVVEVEIRMPNGEWLRLDARVIYRIPEGGFGVFFTEMDEQERRAVAEIIDYHTADGADELLKDKSEMVN